MRSAFLAALMLAAVSSNVAAQTEIRVHYAIPTIWSETQEALREAFMAKHPDIKINLDGPAEGYPEGVQRLLREAVAGTAPDVAYVGLNRWRILEDRGLIKPIDDFLGDDPAAAGYTPALLSLGSYKGTQYALATSASTLVMYVNPDLVEKAGGSVENFPTTFDGVIELAAKIDALGDNIDGVWIDRHDWRFQSLLGSYGGRPMNADETDVTLDSPEGIAAATLYQRFEPGSGDSFKVTIRPLPIATDDLDKVYFPTGGSAIVMMTDDPAKQKAAWEYIAFVTGPEGQKIIVENTGYAPANATVIEDKAYLGAYYAADENARIAHTQVANYAGPWYAFPGAEGVAVTDLIAASLVEITEGAEVQATIEDLAETMRLQLGFN